MKEKFIAYLWRYRLLKGKLVTTDSEKIEVLRTGEPNTDSGPDFFNAIIEIGDEKWSGNVEFHIKASDWYRHGHHTDAFYNNVILHVVYEADRETINQAGQKLPVLCIAPYFEESLYYRYESFVNSRNDIPCQTFFKSMPSLVVSTMLEKALVERLNSKAEDIQKMYAFSNHHVEQTLYYLLAGSFGLKGNVQTFEMLARALPLEILMKHADRRDQVEALLYGVAGMLNSTLTDEYSLNLLNEFEFLRKKYNLLRLQPHIWKFMRMRPVSFPGIRISQFAALLTAFPRLSTLIPAGISYQQLINNLDVSAGSYWDTHYRFGQVAERKSKSIGLDFKNILIINAIIPYCFWRSAHSSDIVWGEMAMNLLEEMPAENNTITRSWRKIGANIKHAFDSQGFYGLKDRYCNLRKCLECRIFSEIIHRS